MQTIYINTDNKINVKYKENKGIRHKEIHV